MIDHASIGTRDLARSTGFYTACLATLGYTLQHGDVSQSIYGADGRWSFALYPAPQDAVLAGSRAHIAFTAPSREAACAFYEAAMARGAGKLREPGPRPDINDAYYGLMIQDPDAHSIEVVHWSR
ncbi:VOC family protein [Pseudoduganella namucuonensis]|uniref:Predicted lactoylglutathione lyase n=1 Tax=Pseudoduganella namucuonensis TaxID=1035707 RepID=A0A1I7KDC9_9BURK|nr:VOC family protein [Pseudoduganella namucuonensis]SFU95340.1 Predicted lactoylglutathione lyase [Pseudoduganella namucuonensis]